MLIIGIDPGDKNTGVAMLMVNSKMLRPTTSTLCGWRESMVWLETMLARPGVETHVVCEDWQLYPWLASEQGFSKQYTPRLCGMIEWECERTHTPLTLQPASIKKPTAGILRKRGVSVPGHNQHEIDASLHLYHYWINDPMSRKAHPRG